MDVRWLHAAITVADTRSVTKAATLLQVAQPALTRQVQALEKELGVPLFERTRSGMLLTPEGVRYVEHARRVLSELDRARDSVAPAGPQVRGTVRLGLLESTTALLAAPLLRRLTERHPRIDLHLSQGYSGHLQTWLEAGELDVSLLYTVTSRPEFEVHPAVTEELCAVAPRGSELDPTQPLPWSELWQHPLVLPTRGHGLRVLVDQAAADTGATPRVVARTNSMRVQHLLVADGIGWTVLPAAGVAGSELPHGIESTRLVAPVMTRSIIIGLPRTTRLSPQVDAVLGELTGLIHKLVTSGMWPTARLIGELAGHTDAKDPHL